jgi:DNA-binding PadR family transcriptional regulator
VDVKTLCLGVLTLGEHSGYQIKKHFEDAFSHFFPAGYGSIYPALAALAAERLVTVTEVAPCGGKPAKKVYALTPAGRARLRQELGVAAPSHRVRSQFVVQLYFAHLLGADALAEKLDERLADIERSLDAVRCFEQGGHPPPARAMVAGLARATLEAQRDFLLAHRGQFLSALAEPAATSLEEEPAP